MDTIKIITTAEQNAHAAKERGITQTRLPVLSFEDWRFIFGRPDDLNAREDHRGFLKRNYYFKYFLTKQGIQVTMVTCKADDMADWAQENNHPLDTSTDRAHALSHYVNQPDLEPSKCVHKRPDVSAWSGSTMELFGSLSTFGENTERPEILSTVVHTRDGIVVDSLDILAIEHSPEEAFKIATDLLTRHGVKNAFHDPTVHRPEFCPDCNELLVHTAGNLEYDQLAH